MNVESELVCLRLENQDLKKELSLVKNILVVLDENDTHTKNILKVLWFDFKKRNEQKELRELVEVA